MTMLSGYRLMWILAMFDLPVGTKKERKAATAFRNYLLDEGFEMAQFSVYMRWCSGREQVEAIIRRIEANMPRTGKVGLLAFTDKQYESIVTFDGRRRQETENPQQYVLF